MNLEAFLAILVNLFIFSIGYIIGSLNTSIILSRKQKKSDVRNFNSGNAGATNSLRTYGKKFAIVVLLIDILKTYIPVLFVAIFTHQHPEVAEKYYISPPIIGLGVVVGHTYPIFFGFKGGKGAACSLGLLCAMNILFLPIASVFFFGTLLISRYVSLSSIVTAFLMIFFCFIPWMIIGPLGWLNFGTHWYIPGVIFLLCAIILIWAHEKNIKNLINKTERKFGKKSIK